MWNIPFLRKYIKRLPPPRKVHIGKKLFKYCVVGGTFDRLHIGHKTLITTALLHAKKLLLCITTDSYVRKTKKIATDLIEPFTVRKNAVKGFLEDINYLQNVEFCPIDDPYSPAVLSEIAKDLDSITISSDPNIIARTERLNALRQKEGLDPLTIIKIPLILDPYGKIFSSTRYRLNDFFPEPRPPEFGVTKVVLEDIRKPKGSLIDGPRQLPDPSEFEDSGIVVIGDTAFSNLVKFGYPISVAILDFKAKREALHYTVNFDEKTIIEAVPAIPTLNKPSTISTYSWFSIMVAYVQKTSTIIRVFGEEDLLGFPATILAPDDALIIYGDPFLSKLVYYRNTQDHRDNALDLLLKMTITKTAST